MCWYEGNCGIVTEHNQVKDDSVIVESKPKSLIGNVSWSLVATVWFIGVSLFITPFLIARLGTDRYGLFVLVMSISGLLGVMDLGLSEATLRFVAYYYGRKDIAGINRVVGATFSVYIVIGLVGWGVTFFAASWIAGLLSLPETELPLATNLIRLIAIDLGLRIISGVFGAVPKALRRFDIDTAVVIGQSMFELLGRVTLLLAGYGVYELVLWQLITTILRQIVNVVVAKHLVSSLRVLPLLSRAAIREVFSYGVFAAATQILGMIWQEADRLLLGALVGSSAVAYLSVTKNLVLRAMRALGSASSVLLPHFSASTELDERRDLFLTATWGMSCMSILVFVPVTILIPDFLRLWIDPEFAEQAAWIGRVVAASCIVRGAFLPYQQLFGGVGKPQYLSAVTLGSGITNLLMNVVLISAFGLAGAGYAYAVSLLWGFGATFFAWTKVLEARSWRPLVRSVGLPIGMGAASLVAGMALRSTLGPLGWVALIGLGAAFLCGTAVLVVGPEWLLGGRTSHAGLLMNAVLKTLPPGPWSRLIEVSSEKTL